MKIRSLLAVALLAPAVTLAAPAAGSKSSSKSSASAAKPAEAAAPASPLAGLEVGGFLGYETDDVSGITLRLDGELPFRELSPQVKMSWVGSIGYSRLTKSYGFADFNSNLVKLVPAARFTLPLNPQFDVFGDVGLGLAYVGSTLEWKYPFSGSFSDSTFNIMMRIGAGAWYRVNPQLKVGAMLEFDPIFGNYGFSGANGIAASSQNTFNILVGGMFRL
jgi:hypothetical protein